MSPSHLHAQQYTQPTFVELFTPKLVTVFREGYGWRDLRADAVAGLTVAVVALPLSMAIAIASGVSPERGLYRQLPVGSSYRSSAGAVFRLRCRLSGSCSARFSFSIAWRKVSK